MLTERRERIVSMAKLGRTEGPLEETLAGLLEAADRALVEGFEKACDLLIDKHDRWRKQILSEHPDVKRRSQVDPQLSATPQAIIEWHDAMIEEIRHARRYQKPKNEG